MIMIELNDLDALRSIKHASPDYHAAYLPAKKMILHTLATCSLFDNEIDLIDPLTAVRAGMIRARESTSMNAQDNSKGGEIGRLMTTYHDIGEKQFQYRRYYRPFSHEIDRNSYDKTIG